MSTFLCVVFVFLFVSRGVMSRFPSKDLYQKKNVTQLLQQLSFCTFRKHIWKRELELCWCRLYWNYYFQYGGYGFDYLCYVRANFFSSRCVQTKFAIHSASYSEGIGVFINVQWPEREDDWLFREWRHTHAWNTLRQLYLYLRKLYSKEQWLHTSEYLVFT
jgi:hypothetical protein